MDSIIIDELTKEFQPGLLNRRKKLAVDRVTLTVKEGEIFGLLGPNGAGKSTLIKMLCTLIEPTSGKATVNSYDIVTEQHKVRRCINLVQPSERTFYWRMTGRQNLKFYAALYNLSPRSVNSAVDGLLKMVGLSDEADHMVMLYSSGMKQRLAIAKALVNDPAVLLLDEPTTGLDPVAARNLRSLIKEHFFSKEKKTVFLSTHMMEEAEMLCDRVAIMNEGRIIALDSPQRLKELVKEEEIVEIEVFGTKKEVVESLRDVPEITHVAYSEADEEKGEFHIRIHSPKDEAIIPAVTEFFIEKKAHIQNASVKRPTLEDVFIQYTGHRLEGE